MVKTLHESNRHIRKSVFAQEERARKSGNWGEWQKIDVRGKVSETGWGREIHTVYKLPWIIVQHRTFECPFGIVEHLIIGTAKLSELSWSEKMKVKNEVIGPERTAIEVFPAVSKVVDQAYLYHLWVLPDGMTVPFGLHHTDPGATGAFTGDDMRAHIGRPWAAHPEEAPTDV